LRCYWRSSLEKRAHVTVAEKIAAATVDTPVEQLEPLEVQDFDGPERERSAAIARICKAQTNPSECTVDDKPEKCGSVAAAFASADLVVTDESSGEHTHVLVVRTAAGWWSLSLFYTRSLYGHYGPHEEVEVTEMAVRPLVTAGPAVLVVRWTVKDYAAYDTEKEDRAGTWWSHDEWLALCGTGAAGRPSCTEPMQLISRNGMSGEGDGDDKPRDWSLEPVFAGGGVVTFRRRAGVPDDRAIPLIGRHRLAFP
jgi:hypothetical protein